MVRLGGVTFVASWCCCCVTEPGGAGVVEGTIPTLCIASEFLLHDESVGYVVALNDLLQGMKRC